MSTVPIDALANPATSFTPTLAFGGGSTGMTTTARIGSYVRVGSLVFFKIDIILTAKGSSTGAASISGLPFAGASDAHAPVSIGFADGMASIAGGLAGIVISSSSVIQVYQLGTGSIAQLTHANFTNTTRLIISGVYNV